MLRRLCLPLALTIFAVLSSGCGDSSGAADKNRRHPVRVTVLLDGKPLPDGQVDFVPLDGRAPGTGQIKDGRAEFRSVAGKCTVEISAFRKFGNMREPENFLPKRFNEQSKLSAEVTVDGENTFNFTVTSR